MALFNFPVVSKHDLKKNLEEQAKYEAEHMDATDPVIWLRQRVFAQAIKLLRKRSPAIPVEVNWMVMRFGLLRGPNEVSDDVIRMARKTALGRHAKVEKRFVYTPNEDAIRKRARQAEHMRSWKERKNSQ